MNKRLQRILSALCILALIMGCFAMASSEEEKEKKQPNRVITVQWNDEDNYEALRPDSLQVSIGDTAVTLNADNGWTGSAYAEEGTEWTVPEVPGYAHTEKGTEITSVIYQHPVARTQLSASVTWLDNGDAAGKRPDSVKLRLLADGKAFGSSLPANSANNWTVTWENLPVNRKGSTESVTYSIEQVDKLTAYDCAVSGSIVTNTLKTGGLSLEASVANVPEGADISGLSLTVSGPDPSMPRTLSYAEVANGYSFGQVVPGAYVVKDNNGSSLVEGYVLDASASHVADAVMVNAGEESSLSFQYAWRVSSEQEENDDPLANAGSLTFQIIGPDPRMPMTVTYAEFTDGTFQLDNLVPGDYAVVETNAEGLIEAYNLSSESITAMTVKVSADGTATASLYNKYTPEPTPTPEPEEEEELIDVPVSKVWVDNDNKDGNRPDSVSVTLYANGVANDSATLSAGNGWSYIFTGLPAKDAQGNDITYSVSEVSVPMYQTSVSGTTIVNTYMPETTSASVSKVWDDDGNEANRPQSVTVFLMPTGASYVLSAENGWSVTVNDLPTVLSGQTVSYSWIEGEVLGYTQVASDAAGANAVFTNRPVTTAKVPETVAQPKTPGVTLTVFEDYDTALGINVLINHVGDCFD